MVKMNNEQALRVCAIMEGLIQEGQQMTDEIREEAARRLVAAGVMRVRADAD